VGQASWPVLFPCGIRTAGWRALIDMPQPRVCENGSLQWHSGIVLSVSARWPPRQKSARNAAMPNSTLRQARPDVSSLSRLTVEVAVERGLLKYGARKHALSAMAGDATRGFFATTKSAKHAGLAVGNGAPGRLPSRLALQQHAPSAVEPGAKNGSGGSMPSWIREPANADGSMRNAAIRG
jgi:hypothetical protein